jgi:hypothetical protein|tara:strand:+ start:54 stop:974 length:921 start_codon:yes stop_codon:yes gene_type:complete
MAIKGSGVITIQDIVNEFGGSNPASLSEYYRGGDLVPNTNSNSNIGASGAIALGDFYGARKEIIILFSMTGAGGAGGNGMANGTGAGSNSSGQKTGIMTKTTYDSLSSNGFPFNVADSNFLPVTVGAQTRPGRVSGGAGGLHGNLGVITGSAGGNSYWGVGGSGGTANQAAPKPVFTHYGAAGGGGGGDDGSTSYLNLYGSDAAGRAGSGGGSAPQNTGLRATVDVEVTYVLLIGAGGNPTDYGNYKGGVGVPGHATFTTSIDDFSTTYSALPNGDGTATSHYTSSTFWFLRIERNGTVYFSKTAP